MKKAICLLFACALMLAAFIPAVSIAQTATTSTASQDGLPFATLNPTDKYVVEKEGETLWQHTANYKAVLAMPENAKFKDNFSTIKGVDYLIWQKGDVI